MHNPQADLADKQPPTPTNEPGGRLCDLRRVTCAVGYSLANCAAIRVDGGYVLVDALPSVSAAQRVKREFDSREFGPVRAVIYTHSHTDHIRGTSVFAASDVPIWAHEKFCDELHRTYMLSRGMFRRGAKQFGYGLPAGSVQTGGIGPPLQMDSGIVPPIKMPTHTVADVAELEIGGVRIELHAAPGETADHLFIWLPDERILLAGDNIYRAFPNLHAIRGVPPRPVATWIDSLDRMRRLQPRPEHLVLGHTEPVTGADEIHTLLTDYRDAIAFVHDSVVRMINQDCTPDEMVRAIRLPPRLRDHPYLQEMYGTIAGAVRGIFAGYMGWFDGSATNLQPLPADEMGQRLIALAGGRRRLTGAIDAALATGDTQWATWLAHHLHAAEPNYPRAANQTAMGLRDLARQTANPLFKNWYLSEAAEVAAGKAIVGEPPFDSRTIADVPIELLMSILPQRLDPRASAKVVATYALEFTDLGQMFTFFVRRGVGEVVAHACGDPDLLIRTTAANFKRAIVAGEVSKLSREFWQNLELVVPGPAATAPFRKLRRLAQFGRILNRA